MSGAPRKLQASLSNTFENPQLYGRRARLTKYYFENGSKRYNPSDSRPRVVRSLGIGSAMANLGSEIQQSFRARIHFVSLYALIVFCIGILGRTAVAQGGEATADYSNHKQEVSMGDSLLRPGSAPLHILYIHGIGAVGAGGSYALRKEICDFLRDCKTPQGEIRLSREYADVEDFDPGQGTKILAWTYLGDQIWKTKEEWHASAPFVDHWILARKNGKKSILVDELNWWPLTLALKCRHILKDEAQLAGTDSSYLALCTRLVCSKPSCAAQTDERFDSFDWLSPDTVDSLRRNRSHAVHLNKSVKIGLMDWGMSDALLAVGPMQRLLIESLKQLLVKCVAASEPKPLAEIISGDSEAEYVVVSHSLGSFLVFSALNS